MDLGDAQREKKSARVRGVVRKTGLCGVNVPGPSIYLSSIHPSDPFERHQFSMVVTFSEVSRDAKLSLHLSNVCKSDKILQGTFCASKISHPGKKALQRDKYNSRTCLRRDPTNIQGSPRPDGPLGTHTHHYGRWLVICAGRKDRTI